ncbi:hypothetical protein D3C73_1368670 [compost metagenome]
MTLSPLVVVVLQSLMYNKRGYEAIGGEMLLPIIMIVLGIYFLIIAGSRPKYPIPKKRFTSTDPKGNIVIDNKDLDEIISYLYYLEEYLRIQEQEKIV